MCNMHTTHYGIKLGHMIELQSFIFDSLNMHTFWLKENDLMAFSFSFFFVLAKIISLIFFIIFNVIVYFVNRF